MRWLRTIKGIGPVTAWTLRREIGRFERFRTGKQLARYCGLTPCNRSSGAREADAGLIRAANPERRRVLIEAAWLLARLQPRWRDLAQRLKAQGKPSTVAISQSFPKRLCFNNHADIAVAIVEGIVHARVVERLLDLNHRRVRDVPSEGTEYGIYEYCARRSLILAQYLLVALAELTTWRMASTRLARGLLIDMIGVPQLRMLLAHVRSGKEATLPSPPPLRTVLPFSADNFRVVTP